MAQFDASFLRSQIESISKCFGVVVLFLCCGMVFVMFFAAKVLGGDLGLLVYI